MKLPQKVIQTQARNPKVTLLPARSQKASVSVEGNFEKKKMTVRQMMVKYHYMKVLKC